MLAREALGRAGREGRDVGLDLNEGMLAVAAWAPVEHARGYELLIDIATRQCGRKAADVLAAPFVLGDGAELTQLVAESGIAGANITLHEGSIQFPSVKEFVRIEVKGSPLAETLSDDAMGALAAESESALAESVAPLGKVAMPMDAHIATARKSSSAGGARQ